MPRSKVTTIGEPKKRTKKPTRRIRPHPMADPNGSALSQLSETKRAYVEARATGSTNREASAIAGIHHTSGSTLQHSPDVQAAYRELMRTTFSPESLVELVKGGATATMPEYSRDGKKKRVADWKTRRPYIQMAMEQAGYVETKDGNAGAVIQVNVTHVGQQKTVTIDGKTV